MEKRKRDTKNRKRRFICGIVFLWAIGMISRNYYLKWKDDEALKKQQETLKNEKEAAFWPKETESLVTEEETE